MIDSTLFPPNPSNGDIADVSGVTFRYDGTIQSWVKVTVSSLSISPATVLTSGTMSAADLMKLNRLIIPPPMSTIIGNKCIAPFSSGGIQLTSGDDFINVEGAVAIQNINEVGDRISKTLPFQIHKHTYGFDFTVNLQALVQELKSRNQINTNGSKGLKGVTGKKGPAGSNVVVAGPKGPVGDSGDSIPMHVSITTEPIQNTPVNDLNAALVDAQIIEAADGSFSINFSRQSIGDNDPQAIEFNVTPTQSTWMLAIDNLSAGPQPLICYDVQQILDALHDKYLAEVDRLRTGYQDVVKFWITAMANLFDEQKAALCCALEFCISGTKSTQIGQHIESLVAATIGKANIVLNPRGSANTISVPSTGVLSEIDAPDHTSAGGNDICFKPLGATFASSVQSARAAAVQSVPAIVDQTITVIDPIVNSSTMTAVTKTLPAGNYVAIIRTAESKINGQFKAPISIRYTNGGLNKYAQFLDVGSFTTVADCKKAYEGLSLSFSHEGGNIGLWIGSLGTNASGQCTVQIVQTQDTPTMQSAAPAPVIPVEAVVEAVPVIEPGAECSLTRQQLEWYSDSWNMKRCCGVVVEIYGQEYIIVKRTEGSDQACGGGNIETPCGSTFGSKVSYAWPTFDGVKFAPFSSDVINFRLDSDLNAAVAAIINSGGYSSPCGDPDNMRHLAYQLSTVLFPVH